MAPKRLSDIRLALVAGLTAVLANIADRRRAQQALRDAQEFSQITIDALSSHLCVLNEAGRIVAVNRSWQEFAEANTTRGSRR